MNKKKLLALIAKKNERKQSLVNQGNTCEDVATLRSINAELDTLNEEIRNLQEMADAMPDDPEGDETNLRTAAVNGDIPGVVVSGAQSQQQRKAQDEEGIEYRKAFMEYVLRGTPIPAELRVDANTLTTDVGSAIPTVLVNRIIEKMETIGMILPRVTRTNYAAGVNIPTSTVKPVATWVAEGAGSDRQKKTTGVITFSKHKLRCEISMSMEVGTMAISAFEAAFVRQVSEAMVKAKEEAILTGNGSTQPKGILTETPVEGQALTPAALNYQALVDAEAALPQAYESGAVWAMSKKTFMGFVGMVDDNKQPIARVNYGINGAPERTLLGRQVVLTGDYLPSYSASLEAGTIYAFLFNFSDYVLNTVYDMGIQRKQDWDTEDLLTKAVMSVDGKVVDKNSLVTLAIPTQG
ncbi:phage major capsid protein, HK97 family [Geosporobacter subterraneus DSM 17957]|uniref:Phage major capsid protein, HK97 family n=1 Tax=Geosporobacter subterraneus DSM 17957 TaxID=1121919 RepID=A0A1M6DQ36_9FIRM|nr:phage major capsid protein [Geosporobacter subterraneus]SHI75290.1 phage major capsid protein, HK97 family [Geosporobacter subterraneus DSM 17957]